MSARSRSASNCAGCRSGSGTRRWCQCSSSSTRAQRHGKDETARIVLGRVRETRVKHNVVGLETERVQAFKNSNQVLLAMMT